MRVRLLAFAAINVLLIPQFTAAQAPVVSPSELRQAITTVTETRQKNLDDVQSFFSSEPARAALKTGKVDYEKVQKAISTLSPEELAKLAAKTTSLQKDFAA